MITSFFVSFAAYVLQSIVLLFPASEGLPSDVSAALTQFGGYVGILSPILPISTMATVFALVITFELSVFGFKGIKWLISHVPFVGGRG